MGYLTPQSELPHSLAPESVSLLRRYQGGDRNALNELLTRYRPRLERIVFVRLGPSLRAKVEVDDVLQGVLIQAMDGLGTFEVREDADMIHWMAKLVENEIIRLARYFGAEMRNMKREASIESCQPGGAHSGVGLELATESASPGSRAAQREMEGIMDECLSELPENYREVILMRDFADGSWEFVAEQVGSPSADAAKHLYQRAWAKLAVAVERRT